MTISLLLTLAGYFGLLYLTARFRNRSTGLLMVFALTGFMRYTLGPILGAYMGLPNGGQLVMTAFAGTGMVLLALSGYVLISRLDFSFTGGFLMIGILVGFLAGPAAVFFGVSGLAPDASSSSASSA